MRFNKFLATPPPPTFFSPSRNVSSISLEDTFPPLSTDAPPRFFSGESFSRDRVSRLGKVPFAGTGMEYKWELEKRVCRGIYAIWQGFVYDF